MGTSGDGGEDLDEGSVALAVLELVDSVDSFMEVLLDEGESLLVEGDLSVGGLLEEGVLGNETFEQAAGLSDDLGGLVVLINLGFEFFLLLSAGVIELVDIAVESGDFLGLRGNESLVDGALGVQGTLELSLELGGVGVGLSEVLIESANVVIASCLEFSVDGIRLLLIGNESVFEGGEGVDEGIEGISSFQLNEDRLEDGVPEGCVVDAGDRVDGLIGGHCDGGSKYQCYEHYGFHEENY